MKLFMSHASRDKAVLWEVERSLPEYFEIWIDERKLKVGENLANALEEAVSQDSDFFILFVDEESIRSKWVRQEIEWALDVEKRTGRTFLLPVVLDRDAWDRIEQPELRGRTYIPCYGYDRRSIQSLGEEISRHIHAWMVEDIKRLQRRVASSVDKNGSDNSLGVEKSLATLEKSLSVDVLKIVHKHGIDDPITLRELYGRLEEDSHTGERSYEEFRRWFDRLHSERGVFQGIDYDGEELFTSNILYDARSKIYIDEKRRIARAALRIIRRRSMELLKGQYPVVALDGGSTTEAIATSISKSVKAGTLPGLSVVTNSVSAALKLAEANSDSLRIYLAGGLVRTSSLAAVSPSGEIADSLTQLMGIVGQVDLAFVGTSALNEQGLSTGTAEESKTKQTLLAPGAQHIIVTDASKFDHRREKMFSSLDNLHVITAMVEGYDDIFLKYRKVLEEHGSTLQIV